MSLSIIFLILSLIAFEIGLYKIFEKADRPAWKALIPFYNIWIWLDIIKKPMWWFIFILIPFINVFVVLLMVVETLKCFRKYSLGAHALGAIFPFVYLPWLGFKKDEKYVDPETVDPVAKTKLREWTDAIVFAVIAATIIRTFFFEAYTIPSSSMEKSLLIGDFLFVSKMSYGPRAPMTPLSIPFMHHSIPGTTKKSYSEIIKTPYHRFPGFGDVERYDAVVFNFPAGDTVYLERQQETYYQVIRDTEHELKEYDPNYFPGKERKLLDMNYRKVARPIDKRENYIKRCIGLPGDSLSIVNQQVYINGEMAENPAEMQFSYHVHFKDNSRNNMNLLFDMGVNPDEIGTVSGHAILICHLTQAMADEVAKSASVARVEKIVYDHQNYNEFRDGRVIPHSNKYVKWTLDNFGPLYIPKAGDKIELSPLNVQLYRRAIEVYENNTFEEKNGEIFINGEKATSYTFKMDYYFMMGDNRHNSADSRMWGFVPENHVVGKAVFVWLSLDKFRGWFDGKLRFKKMFRVVK